MKKIILLGLIFLFLFCGYAYASEKASVQIPSFDITINGEVFDNQNALYPFIVYKDITYAPLTYNLCRELGVITGWDNEKGLYLSKYSEDNFEYTKDLGGWYKKGAKYTASIPSFPVVLNGININSKVNNSLYPVLIYKNITYLPLTWEYVYYEFGWDISWSNSTGLSIDSQNSYISGSYLYLSEINEKQILLQTSKNIYIEKKNDDGSTTYVNTGKAEIKDYRLDLSTNKLTYEGQSDKRMYLNTTQEIMQDCEEGIFTIEDNILLYNGQQLEDLSNIKMNNPSLYVDKWSIGDTSFYEVRVSTDNEIPAPYTPFEQLVFKEINNSITRVKDWNNNDYLRDVYKIGDNYYLCSNGRHVVGRWNNSLSTILKISADGKTTVINNRFEDYLSLRAIGVSDNKLFVEATWFGDANIIDSKGKVSAINDGYFYLDEDNNLNKIYPYIEGRVFLAPNGHLYLLSTSRVFIIDLTTGERIKLSN